MSMTEQDPEDVLDQHYLFFISFANTYYPYVTNERDKKLCDRWLEKLCSVKVEGVTEKRNRNSFLAYFLMNLQEGKMTGPFSKPPEDGPLPEARRVFADVRSSKSVSSEEGIGSGDAFAANLDDFQERSADGRTYVAVRSLPKGGGTYAVVALSLDKEQDDAKNVMFVPCATDRAKLRHVGALRKLTTGGGPAGHSSETRMEDFYMRNIDSKVSGGASELLETFGLKEGEPCGRDPTEIAYYRVLLNQIDEEIRGEATGENELVRFLVHRLEQDLKKVRKMKHLLQLSPEQRNLRLLEILRQKLVIRQQEEKRRNLLAEMEEKIICFGARSDCCTGRTDIATESMWQLAVTKPLDNNDMKKLSNLYPKNAIATFLDLVADDRNVILERGKKRQRRAIDNLRSEVYREIHSGKFEYNKARAEYREWNEILSIVEEMMYEASNRVIDRDAAESVEPRKNDALLMSMIANIKETKNIVIEEARRAEMLTEKIADADTWKFSICDDRGQDTSWQMKSSVENTRREIESCRLLIERQDRRIAQLRGQLSYE